VARDRGGELLTSPPSSLISLTTAWMRSEPGRIGETPRPSTAASRRPNSVDLTRQIGGAARQIRDLAADVGAVAQPAFETALYRIRKVSAVSPRSPIPVR